MKAASIKTLPQKTDDEEMVKSAGWIESATAYAVLFRPGKRDRYGVNVKHIWIPHKELHGQWSSGNLRALHFATLCGMAMKPHLPLSHPALVHVLKTRWLDAAYTPTKG